MKKLFADGPWLIWFLFIVLSLIWGTSFILIKKGLLVFSAGQVGALRIVAAGICLLPFSIPHLNKISKNELLILFVAGLLGSFIPSFLFSTAQTQLDSGITGVLNSLTPLFALLAGAIFFGQKIKGANILGLLLGGVGTILLLSAGTGIGNINSYALLVLLATLCYGLNTNFIKFSLAHFRPRMITAVSLILVLPFAIGYLILSGDFIARFEQDYAWLAFSSVVLLGIMSTAVALILFNRLIQLSTAVFATSVTYAIPVVAIAWGFLDGETLLLGHYLGMGIIVLAVYFTRK